MDAMLTTTLSLVPAISCLTSITVSIASMHCALRRIPSSTSMTMRFSHSIKAAWPWGSGVRLIGGYSADLGPLSLSQLSILQGGRLSGRINSFPPLDHQVRCKLPESSH